MVDLGVRRSRILYARKTVRRQGFSPELIRDKQPKGYQEEWLQPGKRTWRACGGNFDDVLDVIIASHKRPAGVCEVSRTLACAPAG